MNVAEAVGRSLARLGVEHVFGLVGSGNFHVTNALIAAGARYVPAASESGAATMADACARVSGRPTVLSVHQGPGVTNALTGITEAAKSRTPMVVLAPEASNPRSNFHIDLAGAASAVGAAFHRVRSQSATGDAEYAYRLARETGAVILALPLDVQAQEAGSEPGPALAGTDPVQQADADLAKLAAAVRTAQRPLFLVGRGGVDPRHRVPHPASLAELAERCGALLATSAAARGLFAGDPFYLDVCGGFASPLTAELVGEADLVVAWGCTLNMWTTRHARLIAPGAVVAQVDDVSAVLGAYHRVDIPVLGNLWLVASALSKLVPPSTRWRTPAMAERIASSGRWRDVSYVDESTVDGVDPRTLTIALDDLLPVDRTVAVDSGNFMGYPSMFLRVPDAAGFCFTQAYQAIGLGLASAIGAAVARPDRLTVAALGDGGFLLSAAELATAVRLGLPMLIVVYNDAAYGAEVHHFGPDGHPLDTVTFPDTDLASIARGFGCQAATVRSVADLSPVGAWLAGPREVPLLLDAKIRAAHGSWWLEEAFRGH
ncbi:MAG TPA: thiamine pyrophosphate-binding protein [Micromonosporaceae bacterium]|nr:thiamine pyrophosphate-binding protein [Micromonosporaceae bacterium]